MKYYFHKDVELYNKQPLIDGASIINYISATQKIDTDVNFIRNFVKHNNELVKKNSYITLIRGTRSEFINKSNRKKKILEKLPKPVIFHEYKPEIIFVKKIIQEDIPIKQQEYNKETLVCIPELIPEWIPEEIDEYNFYENSEKINEYINKTLVLTQIKIGDKLYVYNDELKIDDSYNLGRIIKSMIWNGYSRYSVIEMIENLAKEYENMNIYEKDKLKEHIELVKQGLNNLIETYNNDNNIKEKIKILF